MLDWKRLKTILFIDNGLFAGVVLFTLIAISWTRFVDWSGPADDLSADQRAHAEDCFAASGPLGDRVLQDRPDCRDVLSAPAAKTVERHPSPKECEVHVIDKPGGDDGLDTCGYPGTPPCLSTPPPGCP